MMKYILAIICLAALTVSCKTTQTVTQADTYSEDLSQYRIALKPQEVVRNTNPTGQQQQNSSSKTNTTNTEQSAVSNKVVELPKNHQTSSIDQLLSQAAHFNQGIENALGFRIQVYSGRDRDEAETMMKDVNTYLKGKHYETAQVKYEQPHYRVKLGNYFSRADCYKIYAMLIKEFPNTIIVSDQIELAPIRRRYSR